MNYEQALLGAVLAGGGKLPADTLVAPEDFAGPWGGVWRVLQETAERREPFDLLLVKDRLPNGSFMELLRLSENLQDPAHLEWYAKKVKNDSRLREIRKRLGVVLETATDYRATVESLEAVLAEFAANPEARGFRSIQQLAESHLRMLESGGTAGFDTGFPKLDALIMGLKPGAPYIIGGRTSNGKTMLAFQIAMNLARAGHPVAYFLLETSGESLAARGISQIGDLPSIKVLRGDLNTSDDWDKIVAAANSLADVPLYVDDSQDLSVFSLIPRILKAKEAYGASVVFVDHMQILESKGDSEKAKLDLVSRTLCRASIECGVPVVALSQLSRMAKNDRPDLSHFKESGNIENDSEVGILVYRHKELNQREPWFADYRARALEYEAVGDVNSADEEEIIWVDVLKNRQSGRLGLVPFVFKRKYGRLEEL